LVVTFSLNSKYFLKERLLAFEGKISPSNGADIFQWYPSPNPFRGV
jgi:hypothetical protein